MNTVDHADSNTFEAAILLYLGCGKLTDGDLAPAEATRILDLTRAASRGLADGYAERVVKDAAATLAAAPGPEAKLACIVGAAEHLAKRLSAPAKAALLDDLRAIANADGAQSAQERDFVSAVARTFEQQPT